MGRKPTWHIAHISIEGELPLQPRAFHAKLDDELLQGRILLF
jgi:hypothetical protein